ncbi:MAG TPA: CsgG/HfaB family protein [Methylomirabilota bacterium]|nr:CsgG/HfaB family protein [Methylomirabilota bacterium]
MARIGPTRGVVLAALSLLLASCATPPSPGAGQAREAYLRGLDLLQAQQWDAAVRAFDEAIQADPRESRTTRLYGMRYGYFPHRDKGIALYRLERWDAAIQALEESSRQGQSEEAARVLAAARRREPSVELGRIFAGTWWDYYERGLLFSERGLWNQAIQDFTAAQRTRSDEDRFARTYGVHFIEYFPLRELGVALYFTGQYPGSVQALERSLARVPTAKAAYYLNLARAALLRQSRVDPEPPRIRIEAPADGLLTNVPTLEVRGTADSRNFVTDLQINGQPVLLEAAVTSFPFVETVSLGPGSNAIEVVVRDLVAREAKARVHVVLDQEGPVVEIERLARTTVGGRRLEGIVYDNVRLGTLTVNGRPITIGGGVESPFAVDLAAGSDTLLFEAADAAGNLTRARLRLPSELWQPGARRPSPVVPAAWPEDPVPAQLREPVAITVDEDLPAEVQEERIKLSWVVQSLLPLAAVKINGEAKTFRQAEGGRPRIFSHTFALAEGENTFTITAVDRTGRDVSRTVKIVRKVEEPNQIGRRLSVAVLPLQYKGRASDLYQGAYDALENALVNQRRFQIVSRVQLEAILKELKFSRTELVDRAKAVEVGRIANAEAILVGTVNVTDRDVEVWAQLINVETSTVLAHQDIYDPVKSPESFRQKIRDLAEKIRQNYPLVHGIVIAVRNQRLAVDLGAQKRVRPDMKVIVYMEGAPIVHPQTKVVLGRSTDTLGEGLLSEVTPQFSFAVIKGTVLGLIERHLAQRRELKVITK